MRLINSEHWLMTVVHVDDKTGVAKKDQMEMTSFLDNIDHQMFLFLNSGKKHLTRLESQCTRAALSVVNNQTSGLEVILSRTKGE